MTKTIGIAGCGIAGLSAGILLRQQGFDVTIFDRFETPSPVGSGLVIQPVGQSVLNHCGVLRQTLKAGHEIRKMVGHDLGFERPILDVDYDPKEGQRFGLAIHRSTLFQSLFDRALKAGVTYVGNASVKAIKDGPDGAQI